MPQPTLFSGATAASGIFEYGTTVRRTQRVRRFQLGDGYEQVTPDGLNTDMSRYDLRTRPISDTIAQQIDDDFTDLKGDFFYANFPHDGTVTYKYRLDPNEWSWEIIGPNSNVISFTVKRVYDYRT